MNTDFDSAAYIEALNIHGALWTEKQFRLATVRCAYLAEHIDDDEPGEEYDIRPLELDILSQRMRQYEMTDHGPGGAVEPWQLAIQRAEVQRGDLWDHEQYEAAKQYVEQIDKTASPDHSPNRVSNWRAHIALYERAHPEIIR